VCPLHTVSATKFSHHLQLPSPAMAKLQCSVDEHCVLNPRTGFTSPMSMTVMSDKMSADVATHGIHPMAPYKVCGNTTPVLCPQHEQWVQQGLSSLSPIHAGESAVKPEVRVLCAASCSLFCVQCPYSLLLSACACSFLRLRGSCTLSARSHRFWLVSRQKMPAHTKVVDNQQRGPRRMALTANPQQGHRHQTVTDNQQRGPCRMTVKDDHQQGPRHQSSLPRKVRRLPHLPLLPSTRRKFLLCFLPALSHCNT